MSSNPTPRPALRKAPDATVHPAAPVAADIEKTAEVESPRPAHLRPVVDLGGSTSDTLRKPGKAKSGQKGSNKKGGKKQQKTAVVLEPPTVKLSKKAKKRHQRRVELHVKVPKETRRALRKNAKARGTSVDEVVTSVLENWLDTD